MPRPRQSGSILAALLVAVLLVVRAAVPLGWMPTQTQDGIRVLLCTGDGSAARTIELFVPKAGVDRQGSGEHPGDPARDPCPFGLSLAKAFDLPAPVALPPMPAIASPGKAPEAVTARIVAARGIRPPARGPPVAA